MSARKAIWVAAAATLLVLAFAWCTDDALITFRAVDNLLAGFGPNYNRDERVMVYTHPLWFWLVSAVSALGPTPYLAAIALGLLLTAVTFYVLARLPSGWVAAALLLGSFSFVTFQTSGLETALTHALIVLLARAVLRKDERQQVVLAGLILLNRLDQLPLLVPLLLVRARRPRVRDWALGFGPLALWEIFSVVYYGFPLPNTAAAKLWPLDGLLGRGLAYLGDFAAAEPVAVALVLALAAHALYRRPREPLVALFTAGACLQLGYVIWVGGDFMRGRFVLGAFVALAIAGAAGLAELRLSPLVRAAALAALAFSFQRAAWTGTRRNVGGIEGRFISNEWAFYRDRLWLWARPGQPLWRRPRPDEPARQMTFSVAYPDDAENYPPNTKWIMAEQAFITDPFTARIPQFDPRSNVGHIRKPVPREYLALEKAARTPHYRDIDRAQLERDYREARNKPWRDGRLERLFFTVCSITRDPIFSPRRLRSMWRWYTGAWERLTEAELQPLREAQRPYW